MARYFREELILLEFPGTLQSLRSQLDAHMNTNGRASMLMIQVFVGQLPLEETGSIALFTSGQYLRPMTSYL